ncbi:MAG: AzlC family ABC transporter permease [Oricola sp.]
MQTIGNDESGEGTALLWLGRGMRQILSLPAVILMSAFVGFAGFARESGVDLAHAVFMTAAIWALPAQVVLIAAIKAGMTLVPTFVAVTLSSVRLMPMLTALVPRLRAGKTRTATLLFLSHFVAVTSWVMANQYIDRVPRRFRTAYFGGFAVTLTTLNIAIVAAVYSFSAAIPPVILGALFFLTPVYFLTSLWATARERVIKYAMVAGLLLGPVFYIVAPEFDLLLAGLAGGSAAFLAGRRPPAANAGEEA